MILNKNQSLNIFILLLGFFVYPNISQANIDLSSGYWETTFDCAEQDVLSGFSCDGLTRYLGTNTSNTCGNYEQITSAANNPTGTGGRGQRHWYNDGTNLGSGGTQFSFSTVQSEFWYRWYMRYPLGFTWSTGTPHYDKLLLIFSDTGHMRRLRLAGNEIGWTDGGQTIESSNASGWTSINGGNIGDGQWHYYEIHFKMDTNSTNGIFEAWVDGSLAVSRTDLDLGSEAGFSSVTIGSNQHDPSNGTCVPVDFDDIAISTTGYIGPINLTYRVDVDNNSTINTIDAMLTLRNHLGLNMTSTNWQTSITTGDANCDGNTSSTDAMLILRYSLGLDMSGTGWCN